MDNLIFSESPAVTIASNTFVRVPVILQYEDTPLIEVIKHQETDYTTRIRIYHSDGTYLAKVVGTRLFTNSDGDKAGITLEYPHRKTVCMLGKKILFEISRQEAAAISTHAELYTPDGNFVKCSDSPQLELYSGSRDAIQVKGVTIHNCVFNGCRIGIWIRKDGSIAIGTS